MEKLILPERSTVANIEALFYNFFNNNDRSNEIEIDFRDVIFIEPSSSTTYLIAILNCCIKNGIKFRINPPSSNGIKIILYTWRFFEVLEETTGIPVNEFCPLL